MKRAMVSVVALGLIILAPGCGGESSAPGSEAEAVEQVMSPQPKAREESCAAIAQAEQTLHDSALREHPEILGRTDSELTPEQQDFAQGLISDYADTLAGIERAAPEEVAVELRNVAPAVVPIMSASEGESPAISAGMMQDALDSMARLDSMCGQGEMFDGNADT